MILIRRIGRGAELIQFCPTEATRRRQSWVARIFSLFTRWH